MLQIHHSPFRFILGISVIQLNSIFIFQLSGKFGSKIGSYYTKIYFYELIQCPEEYRVFLTCP